MAANNKGADQTEWMRRLICAFVVRIWHKQVFSWRGPIIINKPQQNFIIILLCFFTDTWLQVENESEKDMISRSEADALAKLIGAVAYIETSAIEQTGLTECFTKAVNEFFLKRVNIYVYLH